MKKLLLTIMVLTFNANVYSEVVADSNTAIQNKLNLESISQLFPASEHVKLKKLKLFENGSNGYKLMGQIQFTRMYGSKSGHIDLVAIYPGGEKTVLGASNKIATYRGLSGYKVKNFTLLFSNLNIENAKLELQFHNKSRSCNNLPG